MAAVTQIGAISLGNSQGSVQLGSPLDLVFQVQPDAKQTAESSCLRADVLMGDHALSRSDIQLAPQKNTVRIRTSSVVYEPLVTVKLHAGCSGSVSRSYTFFADPPKALAATVEPIDLRQLQASAPTQTATAPAPRPAVESKPRPKPAAAPASSVKKPTPASSPKPAKAATPTAADIVSAAPPITVQATTARAEKPRLRMEPIITSPTEGLEKSRLRVEPIEGLDALGIPSLGPADMDAQTQAILNVNAERLAAMEKQLKSLQAQLQGYRTEITNLQTQLTQAQNQELPLWVYVILALLALALAAIAWLLLRIKQERQNAQDTWADAVLAAHEVSPPKDTSPTTPAPQASASAMPADSSSTSNTDASSAYTVPTVTRESQAQPSATADAQADDLYAEFDQLSTAPSATSVPQQPSLTEVLTDHALFDIQEQAEFYASIGENDQAIEILQTHINEHQSSSPLAHIELLQLLYRLSRTETFEQARLQFEAHFNVQVPNFLGFARKGRDLWSGHPDVLSKIEALWPTDDVQTLLRDLIVYHPGTPQAQSDTHFDLAAFDDLLMLYNVAQATPASERGHMPGRSRSTPTEIPLPEIVLDNQLAIAPISQFGNNANASLVPASATLEAAPLALHEAHLDLLSAAPAQAPLAPSQPLNDSPFQSSSHFAPDEALMDDLSLEWEIPAAPSTAPNDLPDAVDMELNALEAELEARLMDERDLPAPPKPQVP